MSAKILQALHAVMEDVSYVQKTGKNTFHGYSYAGEADLLDKLRPAMLKHGLLLIPSATEITPVDQYGNTTVRMEYTLAHKDGDVWPDKIGAIGTGNDKNKNGVGDKGTYKAITGANKYLLFKLFQIETGDDPEEASDADGIERVTDAEARIAGIKTQIENHNNADEIRRWWSDTLQTLDESWLPRERFEELKALVIEKRKALEERKAA